MLPNLKTTVLYIHFFSPLQPLPAQTPAKQNDQVVLEITIEAHPEPIVKWYREEVEISNSPDFILSQTENTYTLTIVEAFPEDSGRFSVVATNAEGSVKSETYLRVEGKGGIYYLCCL